MSSTDRLSEPSTDLSWTWVITTSAAAVIATLSVLIGREIAGLA